MCMLSLLESIISLSSCMAGVPHQILTDRFLLLRYPCVKQRIL